MGRMGVDADMDVDVVLRTKPSCPCTSIAVYTAVHAAAYFRGDCCVVVLYLQFPSCWEQSGIRYCGRCLGWDGLLDGRGSVGRHTEESQALLTLL